MKHLSLRSRLVLLVGVIVAVVIAIESYLEIRTFERSVQNDRLEAAAATAQAVADDLELRGLDEVAVVQALLHEFLAATPLLRDIAAFRAQNDTITVIARTSSEDPDDLLPAARRAAEQQALVWLGA